MQLIAWSGALLLSRVGWAHMPLLAYDNDYFSIVAPFTLARAYRVQRVA
jgi:hypothetical protein